MSDTKQVSAALVKAQRAFGPALKDKTNPAFRSKYADLGACIEAVIDALNGAGIALIQRQHPHDGGVSVETVFVHESGESLSCGILSVPASKQDPQGYGSALTYARRYSLMAACGIAPEDDDGNAASKRPGPEHRPANGGSVDMSPKARASRIAVGVAGGDAAGAALAMSAWEKPLLDSVWALLDVATQDKLTEAWPE
jgi:ERF superfamily